MISFNTKLNKAENLFLQYIIKNCKNKIFVLKFNDKELINIISPFEKDKILFNFLKKFLNKKIKYSYKNINGDVVETVFPIISYVSLINENYEIKISEKIIEIFSEKNQEINENNFNIFLSMSNDMHRKFMHLIVNYKHLNNSFSISIDDLKKELNVTNKYSRFYDFEKHIIVPFIKNTNETNVKISYEIIHKKESKTSKIIGLRFFIKIEKNIQDSIEKLIFQIKEKSKNPLLLSYTAECIDELGYSYVKKNFDYALLHPSKNFERHFLFCLKYDYFNNEFKNNVSKYIEYEEILSINKIFNTKDDLIKFIIKQKNININEKAISEINYKNYIDINYKQNILVIEYNGPIYPSKIKIYRKTNN